MTLSRISEYRNWIVAVITIFILILSFGSSAKSDVVKTGKEYTDNKIETIDAKLNNQKEAIEKISVKIDKLDRYNREILERVLRCTNERD